MTWVGGKDSDMNLDDINELIGVATSGAAAIEAVSRAVKRLEAVQAAQVQLQTLPSDVLREALLERTRLLKMDTAR